MDSRKGQVAAKGAADTSSKDIKLVLLGCTGSGKSTLGNIILDLEQEGPFKVGRGFSSCTKEMKQACITVDDINITVVDTPGLLDVDKNPKDVAASMANLGKMVENSISAFVIVLPVQAWTIATSGMLLLLEKIFTDELFKHSVIVFTKTDSCQLKNIDEIIATGTPDLKKLLKSSGNRCIGVSGIKIEEFNSFRKELLANVDKVITYGAYDLQLMDDAMKRITTIANSDVKWPGTDVQERLKIIDGILDKIKR